ncbi:DUF2267 domain-containing protein [Nocardia pseudobrasiliensis]|uniref:Uncharacterized protein (DUF2267 family) n=1 Tax=Nocardia pseudobrasiliensis TaxID=45979 RepID=A0A370HPK7_9NOCA|nr:DUF2267 domain-containing protein [Nocardia pseudobrasiliensis]RDI60438.1 uncharacterized protein (DUF2267 family) [Nocardia pseudobrasiliensis]
MSPQNDPLTPAVHTAHEWLKAVADRIGTEDRAFTYHVVRAWLHTVRDRISVVASAHLTAQLPEILRGVYYEGWVPSHIPVGHGTDEFLTRFAHEAMITRAEVPRLAGAVTDVFMDRCSPGQLDGLFAVLPVRLQELLRGFPETHAEIPKPVVHADTHRIEALERRLQLLGDTVAILARGLEELPTTRNTDDERRSAAAQQAHRILMREHLTTTTIRR